MNFAKRQSGLGLLGWLILVLVVGGAVTIGIKLIPLYIDNRVMSNDLEAMAEAPNMMIKADHAIRENLQRRFSIDNIRDFDFQKNIIVKRTPEHVYVTMAYEVRMPLIANVDLVASFNKQVELKN